LHAQWVNEVGQTETHMAEPLVAESRSFEAEIAIEKLKRYKPPPINQILVEVIQEEGNTLLHFEIHKLINSIWNKEELPQQESTVIKLTVVIIEEYHRYQLHTTFYSKFFCQG
jgi:hypothetical protein